MHLQAILRYYRYRTKHRRCQKKQRHTRADFCLGKGRVTHCTEGWVASSPGMHGKRTPQQVFNQFVACGCTDLLSLSIISINQYISVNCQRKQRSIQQEKYFQRRSTTAFRRIYQHSEVCKVEFTISTSFACKLFKNIHFQVSLEVTCKIMIVQLFL